MTRKLFDKPAKEPALHPIPDGCADIARALGLDPAKTYWDYNSVYSPESGLKFPNSIISAIGAAQEGITTLIRSEANGLTLRLHEGFLDYQRQYAGVTNVTEVTRERFESNKYTYPEHSVIRQLDLKVKEEPRLRDKFNDAVFCSLMPVTDIQPAVQELGGRTLISGEQAVFFNSKVRVVRDAESNGYNVAPFVVAQTFEELESRFADLARTARDIGIDADNAKYWIKLDNLASGAGVLPYEPAKTDFQEVKDWIRSVLADAEVPKGQFIPVVMDIDIGALPEVKRVITNLNVQGIVGPEGVAVTGTTFQKTQDGHYIGGALPLTTEEKAYAKEGHGWALPVLEAAQKQGYRGYAGIDIILCEDTSGSLRGYILEMNGRINSSTSLLSMSQWVARESGQEDVAACNLTATFKSPLRDFTSLQEAFNSVMYKGRESGFEGIVPIILRPDENGAISNVKLIAVAPTPEKLAKLEKRYTAIANKL